MINRDDIAKFVDLLDLRTTLIGLAILASVPIYILVLALLEFGGNNLANNSEVKTLPENLLLITYILLGVSFFIVSFVLPLSKYLHEKKVDMENKDLYNFFTNPVSFIAKQNDTDTDDNLSILSCEYNRYMLISYICCIIASMPTIFALAMCFWSISIIGSVLGGSAMFISCCGLMFLIGFYAIAMVMPIKGRFTNLLYEKYCENI